MKKRILSGWNFPRVVYLLAGLSVMAQAVYSRDWVWLLPGAYFASMGLFAFGCAAGNCFGGNCYIERNPADDQKKSAAFTTIQKD